MCSIATFPLLTVTTEVPITALWGLRGWSVTGRAFVPCMQVQEVYAAGLCADALETLDAHL